MEKYTLRAENSAEYLDMPIDTFLEHVAPFCDSISVEDVHYYLREDLELVVKMFFRAPQKENVTRLHPVS